MGVRGVIREVIKELGESCILREKREINRRVLFGLLLPLKA